MIKVQYLLLVFAALNIFARCEDNGEKLYPNNAVRFSQDFIIAIKTEQPFEAYRDTLRNLDIEKLKAELTTPNQKLAFWINTYNSMVQAKIKDDVKQFDDLDSFFKSEDQMLGGIMVSLDQVENGILRRKEISKNEAFLSELKVDKLDPRIHFTLNCGASSCPPIAYYSVDKLDEDLSLAEESFVTQSSKYDKSTNTLEISELFNWFEEDFGGKEGVLVLFKRLEIIPEDATPLIIYTPYDWNLDLENF